MHVQMQTGGSRPGVHHAPRMHAYAQAVHVHRWSLRKHMLDVKHARFMSRAHRAGYCCSLGCKIASRSCPIMDTRVARARLWPAWSTTDSFL